MSQRLLGYTNMSLQVELCPKKTIEKLEVRGQGQLQNILLLFTKEPQAQLQKFLMSKSIRIPIFAEWHKTIYKPRS